MQNNEMDKSYITVRELENDLFLATGNPQVAKSRAHLYAIAYRGEVIDTLKYKQGVIDEKALSLSRHVRWQQAENHSRCLEKNMLASGRSKPANTSAHHIVAWNHPRAARARLRLAAFQIDIDHEANGVFLPRFKRHTPMACMPDAKSHSVIHTNAYFLNVEYLLTETIAEGLGRNGIINLLLDIGDDLLAGRFPVDEEIIRA